MISSNSVSSRRFGIWASASLLFATVTDERLMRSTTIDIFNAEFRTDGKTIFLQVTEKDHEGRMIDLKKRQQVFRTIVEPSLRDLEFEASIVARWYPLGMKHQSVVVDPARSFGRPIVRRGVPTEILAEAVKLEGSVNAVALLYEVPRAEIRSALEFERRLAA